MENKTSTPVIEVKEELCPICETVGIPSLIVEGLYFAPSMFECPVCEWWWTSIENLDN